MKTFSDVILNKANALLAASKSLDYQGIIKSNPDAVVQLRSVLQELSIEDGVSNEGLDDYASKQEQKELERHCSPESESIGLDIDQEELERQAAMERKLEITATMSAEGLEGHLGKVYNSFASERIMKFEDVPTKKGLPIFDMVFAADYSPLAGLHGIFISKDDVMSIVLASDTGPNAQWEILKSKNYSSQEELMEYVTLLSAGFELP